MKFEKIESTSNSIGDIYIFLISIIVSLVWLFFFNLNILNESFIWDDLHLIRKYSLKEISESFYSNWDSDNIETFSYRPFSVVIYALLGYFGENFLAVRITIFIFMILLIYFSSIFFKNIGFKFSEIFIFIILITFSKIYSTLFFWMTLAPLIFCYICFFLTLIFFNEWLTSNNKKSYYLSIFFSALGIFTREELYYIPLVILLIFLLQGYKKFLNKLYFLFPFFFIVLVHIVLRKYFVPEADNFNLTNNGLFFGNTQVSISNLFKALKASFLPMGLISLKKINIIFWLGLIWIINFFLLFMFSKKEKNLIFLFIVVILTNLPSLAVPRSFGIFVPSTFALAFIIKIFLNLKFSQNSKFIKFFNVIIAITILIGVLSGILRTQKHFEAMNSKSFYIVKYNSDNIYGYKDRNILLSIPIKRVKNKVEELNKLNINEFNYKILDINNYKNLTNDVYLPDYRPGDF